jgi:hypothetical protein
VAIVVGQLKALVALINGYPPIPIPLIAIPATSAT